MLVSRKWWVLVGLVYLVACWFSAGYNQSDEHFQILEYAGLHLGMNDASDLAWEYGERMRPGLQVAMAYGVHRALALFGEPNPFIVVWLLRVFSAVFSLLVAYLLFTVFRGRYGQGKLAWWFFLFSFFLWFGVYNGIRFNSENWAGNCFALALGLYTYWRKPSHLQYLLLGSLVGLSFVFRYQMAIMIAAWGLWLIFVARERWGKLLVFTFGGLLMAAFGVVFDRWLYGGEWVFSAWHYFEQNILLDKASGFGVDPWWYYLKLLLIKGIPPFSIFYLLAIAAFFWLRPRHWLSWLAISFIVLHSFIAHKELRFLYPLLPFLPIALAELLLYWQERYGEGWWKSMAMRWFKRLFWGHNVLLLIFISFWPIIPEMDIYRLLYRQYPEPIALYGVEDNPYQQALDVRYYRRPNLQIKTIETFAQLPRDTTFLLAFDQKHAHKWLKQLPPKKQLIHKSYPDWVEHFNFNDWLSRTQQWYVYELRLE